MSSPEWSKSFETGIEVIDLQHRMLFDTVAKLEEAIREGKAQTGLKKTLTEIDNYINEHFIAEEELFAKHRYPKAAAHRAAHRQFGEEVLAFYPRFEDHTLDALAMCQFLRVWLHTHVMRMDMDYKDYFKSTGVI